MSFSWNYKVWELVTLATRVTCRPNDMASGDEDKVVRQLVQNLRSDLSLLSNEAKKKYPAVKEVTHLDFFPQRNDIRNGVFYR